jgi:hypothetical protein
MEDADTKSVEHRSFRLTETPTPDVDTAPADQLHDAVTFAVVQQGIVVPLCAMVLDGGTMFVASLIACAAFWIMAVTVLVRRRRNVTAADVWMIKFGYLPMIAATYVGWLMFARNM